MISMRKEKTRRAADAPAEQDAPAEVNSASVEVSEQAECCLADIDEVLGDTDQMPPAETEEQQARREADELWARYNRGEISYDHVVRERDALYAKYAHLDLGGCWC